jgi:hypothetical protein
MNSKSMAAVSSNLGKRALRIGGLGLLLVGLPGCQSITINAANLAQLRIIDASPDAPPLDFYQNQSVLAYNVGFGTASSYVPLPPANYTLSADQAGTRTVLTSNNATLSAAHQYTAIVGNVLASLQTTILQDQTQPAPSGQISVRILNWATRAGTVDIYLIPSSATLTTVSPVATNVTFQGNTGYINIPAATYAIAVVPAGTVPVSSTATLLSGSQQAYGSGSVHTVVLIDQQIITVPGVKAIVVDDYESPTTQG